MYIMDNSYIHTYTCLSLSYVPANLLLEIHVDGNSKQQTHVRKLTVYMSMAIMFRGYLYM